MPERLASFASLETPIGRLWLSGTDAGLLVVSRSDDPGALLADLDRRRWGAIADAESLGIALRELAAYFAGSLRAFSISPDLREIPAFEAAVYRASLAIPFGEAISYGELAAMAGSPRAARAVGNAMARCPFFPVVPCHRVIRANGSIGGWGADEWVKRWLLEHEGGRAARKRAPRHLS